MIGKGKIMQQPWVWNYQTAQTRVSEEVFASFGDWKNRLEDKISRHG